MEGGITQILSKPDAAGLSEAHQKLVREKFIAATRVTFSARDGKGKDKDSDYQDVDALGTKVKLVVRELSSGRASIARVSRSRTRVMTG